MTTDINNIDVQFEVVHPEQFTIKDSILLNLSSLMAIPIDNVLYHLRKIDRNYRKGVKTPDDYSLQIWSAYVIYSRYLPIVDNERFKEIDNA